MSLRSSFLVMMCLVLTISAQDLILPPPKGQGVDIAVVMIQGAELPAVQYNDTLLAIQAVGAASNPPLRVWAGCPDFFLHTPEPLVIQGGFNRIYQALEQQGMPKNVFRVGIAHSLGGIMLQGFLASNTSAANVQVLLGSFLNRKYNSNPFPIPTLTIAGELDGLCRLFRMAESYNFHVRHTENADRISPVVVIPGLTHMQFAGGVPPSNVKNNDLVPEITYDDAHNQIATLVLAFATSVQNNAPSTIIQNALQSSTTYFGPILDAYEQEGNTQIKPPCNCCANVSSCPFPLEYHFPIGEVNYYACPQQKGCRAESTWASVAQQSLAGLTSIRYNISVSFHPVSQENPSNLPKIFTNCSKPDSSCLLTMTGVAENVYASDILDTGFYTQAATEIRAKMSSRQEVYLRAGIPNADFNVTDSPNLCAEANQISLNWALQHAPANTVARFQRLGQQIEFGPDVPEIGGPWWINNALNFNVTGPKQVVVTSPMMKFPDPFPLLPFTCCFHYCKLLSPARALEWLMLDGLRANDHL
eukprot:PhF_6_TR39656/c1_g1_i1/m.58842